MIRREKLRRGTLAEIRNELDIEEGCVYVFAIIYSPKSIFSAEAYAFNIRPQYFCTTHTLGGGVNKS